MSELNSVPVQGLHQGLVPTHVSSQFRVLIWVICVALASAAIATGQAQPHASATPPEPGTIEKSQISDDKPILGSVEDEMRVKRSIKLLEKEYKQNVERAREVADLGAQLRDALKNGRTFGPEEYKKLERLEKLARKIRSEAGGTDEEDADQNLPNKLDSALSRLADVAESLFKAVEKTPRQVISAAVIEKANALLHLARITRNFFH